MNAHYSPSTSIVPPKEIGGYATTAGNTTLLAISIDRHESLSGSRIAVMGFSRSCFRRIFHHREHRAGSCSFNSSD